MRNANMRTIRSKGTKPVMAVRCLAHAMGYSFRFHRKDLLGKPDRIISSHRGVIFIYGYFWCQQPKLACKDARSPKLNSEC